MMIKSVASTELYQSISALIHHFIFISFIFFNLINCDGVSKCFKNSAYKEGPLTVFEFTSLIDKVLIIDDYLIVAGLNDLYLLDHIDLKSCLYRAQLYNNSRLDLEPQNRNRIMLEIDKDLKKFLVCNTMHHKGCSIFYLEHGHLRVIEKNFDFNLNSELKFCLISKLDHEKNFILTCEPDRTRNHLMIGKMRFDEDRNVFQMVKIKDKKSMVNFNEKEMGKIKIDLVYDFDQLMVNTKDRFYYANILKREQPNEQDFSSKLGRVCLGDNSFRSYTEMKLACVDKKTGEKYTYSSHGHLGYAYSNLHKDTLYVAFNKYDNKKRTIDQSKGTVLCAFDSDTIDKFYSDAIKECYFGNSSDKLTSLMTHYSMEDQKSTQCVKQKQQVDDETFLNCPKNSLNAYVQYHREMIGEFMYKFDQIVVSLSAFLFRSKQQIDPMKGIVLVTDRSRIYKLIRENSTMRLDHVVIKQIESFVAKDSIYLTTGQFMIKYPLNPSSIDNTLIVGTDDHTGRHDSRKKQLKHKNKVMKTSISKNFGQYFVWSTIVLIVLIIALICFMYSQFRTMNNSSSIEIVESQEKVYLKSSCVNNTEEMLSENNILIHQSYLTIFEKVGSGFFGSVYRGQLNLPGRQNLEVAIKTLNICIDLEDSSLTNLQIKSASKSLIDEALIMKDFKHQNILPLIGGCVQENSLPKIILPFMSKGSLINYIRSDQNLLTVRDLIQFAVDVAKGMSYLTDLRFIHRDLAARNCMLDNDLVVKICDFGLSKDIYERNYYVSKTKTGLPIKWMSPESIEKCITKVESEVWSYGVLFWELMTRGNIPYPTVENHHMLDYLKENNRLPRPVICPTEIYELMLDCWQIDPNMRPTFGDIIRRIRTIIMIKEIEMEHKTNLSVNYVNFPIENYYSIRKCDLTIAQSSSGYCSDYDEQVKEFKDSKKPNILDNVIEMPGQQN